MVSLVVFVVSVSLVDSLNPSTIAPALYLATGREGQLGVAGFVAGVFVVSTSGGLSLTLGPGQVLLASVPHPGRHVTHLIELILGGAVLLLAVALWTIRERVARKVVGAEERNARNSFLLGAGIMAVELPTALPYFAVIAAVIAGGGNVVTQIVLVLLFNGIFVAPLLLILAVRRIAGERGVHRLARFRSRLNQWAALIIPGVALVAAAALLLLGSIGLASE
jgi:cytochrome c biogenesis protein CcdA